MAGIREVLKTVEGIQELAFILSVPVEIVERTAKEMLSESENKSEQIIDEI